MSRNLQNVQSTNQAAVVVNDALPDANRDDARHNEKMKKNEIEVISLRGRDSISVEEARRLQPSAMMENLADLAWNRAGSYTRHYCLGSVTNVLLASDVIDTRIAPRAIDGVSVLRRNSNFLEVKNVRMSDLDDLPAGTVVIYEKPGYGSAAAGHAQILCGDGRAASDFRHDLNVYNGTPRHVYAFIPVTGGHHTFRAGPDVAQHAEKRSLPQRIASAVRGLPIFRGRSVGAGPVVPAMTSAPMPAINSQQDSSGDARSAELRRKTEEEQIKAQQAASEAAYKDIEDLFGWKELRKQRQQKETQQWSEEQDRNLREKKRRDEIKKAAA